MAGTSLLMLLDDIAAVLDDVSVMTKVAAKKTAGVLGDDLALNAEQTFGAVDQRFSSLVDYAAIDAGRGVPVLRRGRKTGA